MNNPSPAPPGIQNNKTLFGTVCYLEQYSKHLCFVLQETSNENGGLAADSETIPDQSQAEESPQTTNEATEDTAADETVTSDAAEPVEATPDQSEEAQTDPTTAESNEEPAPAQSGTFTFLMAA